MKKTLNERQKRAADFFIELGNKTQALIKAGYSKQNAGNNASRFFEQKPIKDYVEQRLKLLDEERIASAREVMRYLTSVMRGEEKEQVVVIEGEGDGVSSARNVEKSIPAKDRIKAAELLGKRFGIYTDKVNIDSSVSVIIKDDVNE